MCLDPLGDVIEEVRVFLVRLCCGLKPQPGRVYRPLDVPFLGLFHAPDEVIDRVARLVVEIEFLLSSWSCLRLIVYHYVSR